jgi:hypothetical protein
MSSLSSFSVINCSVFTDSLAFCLNDLRETAARRIQTAWRGYRARRKCAEVQDELRRKKVHLLYNPDFFHKAHSTLQSGR